ncbi:YrdB family protein [Streptacidiphilus sp. ASG 303]|uniref:YrdB family protein n=1 Tax=Streptacidiphilus sp. ASG 303 TaxID=2896847 RepID=UPI001E412EC6|nr:YrdB family protein [Streptacidiphilus sp. ASG 303]MCD0484569.1 YrdB family protein [Streptacidiphilus sp. ASG 303]
MIRHAVEGVDAVLAFLVELAVYAAAGYWGFTRDGGLPKRLLLALGTPALLILAWGLFGAPTAAHPVHGPARALLELCWFGSGAAALWASRGRRPALLFAAAYLLSTAVRFV